MEQWYVLGWKSFYCDRKPRKLTSSIKTKYKKFAQIWNKLPSVWLCVWRRVWSTFKQLYRKIGRILNFKYVNTDFPFRMGTFQPKKIGFLLLNMMVTTHWRDFHTCPMQIKVSHVSKIYHYTIWIIRLSKITKLIIACNKSEIRM